MLLLCQNSLCKEFNPKIHSANQIALIDLELT